MFIDDEGSKLAEDKEKQVIGVKLNPLPIASLIYTSFNT